MLCLGMKDKAIKMLLESTAATNPSEPLFYEYNLRACLAATCRSAPNDTSQNGKLQKFFWFSIAYNYYLIIPATLKSQMNLILHRRRSRWK